MMRFIFGQTDWYKKILHDKYVEQNKDFPTGHEVAFKYNVTQSPDEEVRGGLDFSEYNQDLEHIIL